MDDDVLGDSGSGTVPGGCATALGSSSVAVGVVIAITASVGINVGQNLQAVGLQSSPEAAANPCSSRTWTVGLAIFITGSLLNFAAFSFAAASIVVPIEAVQFVTNVMFSKFVNKVAVTWRTTVGTLVAVAGTVVTVGFGPNADRCYTLDDLTALWSHTIWWLYIGATAGVAALSLALHLRHKRRVQQGKAARHGYTLPVTFALTTSLLGGSQMIVHSKAIAELFKLIFSYSGDGPFPMARWYFWVEFGLLAGCGIFWLLAMNHSLGVFDPLFIIPLMQSSYILFGVIAGGIYFGEFSELSSGLLGKGTAGLFVGGLCLIMLGLYLIAPEVTTEELTAEEGAGLPAVPEDYALQESGRSSFSRPLAVTGLPSASLYGTPRNSFDSATDSQLSYVTARSDSTMRHNSTE